MEEPFATSNSNTTSTQRTTGKLPPEHAAHNSTSSTSIENEQNQAGRPYDNLQLIVIEAFKLGEVWRV